MQKNCSSLQEVYQYVWDCAAESDKLMAHAAFCELALAQDLFSADFSNKIEIQEAAIRHHLSNVKEAFDFREIVVSNGLINLGNILQGKNIKVVERAFDSIVETNGRRWFHFSSIARQMFSFFASIIYNTIGAIIGIFLVFLFVNWLTANGWNGWQIIPVSHPEETTLPAE